MALVGTVELNKPESTALFVNGKQSLLFYLCCTGDLTPLSYVPARNKTMMTRAWVNHKTRNFKLSCTIMTVKSGVDVLDKLV